VDTIRLRPLFVAAAALISGCANQSGGSHSEPLTVHDRTFVMQAAQGGYAEVATGKLAATMSPTDAVRSFGNQMVSDHTNSNMRLAAIAKSKGITVPSAPDAAHQAIASKLSQLQGAEFDRLYIAEPGLNDHKTSISLYEDEATKGADRELRAFAQETLPVLRHHLEMVQALQSNVR
jgi:putative membrane protein